MGRKVRLSGDVNKSSSLSAISSMLIRFRLIVRSFLVTKVLRGVRNLDDAVGDVWIAPGLVAFGKIGEGRDLGDAFAFVGRVEAARRKTRQWRWPPEPDSRAGAPRLCERHALRSGDAT